LLGGLSEALHGEEGCQSAGSIDATNAEYCASEAAAPDQRVSRELTRKRYPRPQCGMLA
jgi:hypothetical protein